MLYDKKWDEQLPVDNFMSAKELRVSAEEHIALQQVLKMLESGEIQDIDPIKPIRFQPVPKGLFMSSTGCQTACGTAACIGGWVATLMDVDPAYYVWDYGSDGKYRHKPLRQLYFGNLGITPSKQAAQALRNFLTKGNPDWKDVMKT